MIQTIERDSAQRESGHLRVQNELGAKNVPSELVIPAVQGKFYTYSSEFAERRSLYALMSCKANKGRSIENVKNLGREVNFLFLFDDSMQAMIYPIQTAHTSGLLGDSVKGELFDEAWIAPIKTTIEDFYDLRSQKDTVKLMEICQNSCLDQKSRIIVKPGMVVAMMTSAGKFGMFLIKELTPTSIRIDACHILV
ncbi:MAG: hypothetical protein WD552_02360 [Candidatus Paceibacterota bacterium]